MPRSLVTTQIDRTLEENERNVVVYSGIHFLDRNELCGSLFSVHTDRIKVLKKLLTEAHPDIEGEKKGRKLSSWCFDSYSSKYVNT